jgi:hypothetical protein
MREKGKNLTEKRLLSLVARKKHISMYNYFGQANNFNYWIIFPTIIGSLA